MIAHLHGTIIEIVGRVITLDVQGVGYEVHCSRRCLDGKPLGDEVSLVVLTDVKEDSIRLYGFADRLERQVFQLLTAVKGVGARSAAEIISRIEKRDLLRIIGAGDVARLQAIRGIGRKTAERIVVELKDKVADFVSDGLAIGRGVEVEVVAPFDEAVEALCALGFARKEAESAVGQVESLAKRKMDSGEIVKEALQFV